VELLERLEAAERLDDITAGDIEVRERPDTKV
jgi:hypothetical protein